MATAKKVARKVKEVAKKVVKKVVKKKVEKEVMQEKPAFVSCETCSGRGLIDQHTLCSHCGGDGKISA